MPAWTCRGWTPNPAAPEQLAQFLSRDDDPHLFLESAKQCGCENGISKPHYGTGLALVARAMVAAAFRVAGVALGEIQRHFV